MRIPKLPLVDNALILDNSLIEQLQYCPRSYLLKYSIRRIPVVPAAGRNFGSACHVGWDTRYKLCGEHRPSEAQNALITSAITDYFLAHPQPENDFRTLDHALMVMRVYNEVYGEESFKLLATVTGPIVEQSFLLPIGKVGLIDIFYAGKIDLALRDSSGLWVLDHKTAFQFGQQFESEMAMDTGQLGYCWAGTKIFGERFNGYITNAVRIRKPNRRSEEYNDKAPCDKTDFKRLVTVVSEDRLQEFEETVLDWAENLIRYHEIGRFPRVSGKKGCVGKYGLCDFYDVCQAPTAAREGMLASPMFEDNEWTPLKKGSE